MALNFGGETIHNKKSELMLMGRATASVQFRTQVVLVYRQYISAKIHSKCINSLKTYFGVQGRSRSSMSVPPESSSPVLVMMRSKSVSICNRSHARRANSGKITISRGYRSLMPSFEENLLTQRHQITSLETRNARLSCGENPESLSDLGLIRYRVVTPGQTDGRTDGQTEFP